MKPSLGIEIGDKYLKLVAARPAIAKQGASVDFAVEPISHLPDDQIIKKIASFLAKTKFKPKSTTICIPRNMLTVKTLQLPTRDSKESEQMIDLHLGRLVPYKKEDILFGHRFLGVSATGYATEMLAIVRRATVRRQCNIVEGAGLAVDRIALSSHAAWQWTLSNFRSEMNEKDLYMLLDVDYSFVDLIIFNLGQVLFSRTINIEAGEGGLGAPDMAKLVNEIKQSLIIFYNEALHKKPSAIFLAGSSSAASLREKIETEFGLPVKEAPPAYARYPAKGRKALPGDVSMSAVSELVLEDNPNRIYFILPEMQIKKTLREKTRELIVLGTLAFYFFAAIMAFFVGGLYIKQSYLNLLHRQGMAIEESVGVMIDQAKKIEFVKEFLHERKEIFALLQELQKITPPKIAVNYIGLDGSYSMTLRGEGEQLSSVLEFTALLGKSAYFKNVVTKRTRTRRVKDREVTDFEITLNSGING